MKKLEILESRHLLSAVSELSHDDTKATFTSTDHITSEPNHPAPSPSDNPSHQPSLLNDAVKSFGLAIIPAVFCPGDALIKLFMYVGLGSFATICFHSLHLGQAPTQDPYDSANEPDES